MIKRRFCLLAVFCALAVAPLGCNRNGPSDEKPLDLRIGGTGLMTTNITAADWDQCLIDIDGWKTTARNLKKGEQREIAWGLFTGVQPRPMRIDDISNNPSIHIACSDESGRRTEAQFR